MLALFFSAGDSYVSSDMSSFSELIKDVVVATIYVTIKNINICKFPKIRCYNVTLKQRGESDAQENVIGLSTSGSRKKITQKHPGHEFDT